MIVCWSLEHVEGSDGEGKDQSRRVAAEAAAISSPSSTPAYPPSAAAFANNEAGGSMRKPSIKQARRCQDLPFLSIISLLAFGFIVDTSFNFNRGDPHRSVCYQSPVLQSIESSAKFLSMSLYWFLQFSVSLGLRGSLKSKVSSVSFNFNDN